MLKDILDVNIEAFKRTIKGIKYVPLLAVILIIFNVFQSIISSILITNNQASNFILGFARYIIEVAFLSALINILDDLINYNRFNLSKVIDGFTRYMSPLMNTLFIIYVVELLIDLTIGSFSFVLRTISYILILVFRSPLNETIYIANSWGMPAIYDIFDFLKNNFLHWILPLILFVVVELYFNIYTSILLFNLSFILLTFIFSLILAFIYLYKGHLFKILYNSSFRKRKFEGMF